MGIRAGGVFPLPGERGEQLLAGTEDVAGAHGEHEIAGAHGGAIRVESVLGEGTTFEVTLPA